MPGKKPRLRGKGKAIVILRKDLVTISGVKIHERAFRVQNEDLGTVKVLTPRIKSIIYKNLPLYPKDELKTWAGSILPGIVLNDPVTMEAEDLGGRKKIAKSKILSIVWW